MSWKEGLRTASFRGVTFQFEEVASQHGRRLAKHEYPLRDLPYTQDLGRKQRGFTITAYVVGDDYISRKEALIAAAEKEGPGEFIHPLKGSVTVNCEVLDVRESKDAGRMATFQISFWESGLRQYPGSITDPNSVIGGIADSLIGASATRFVNDITVLGVPEFVRTALKDTVGDIGGIMETLQNGGALNLFPDTQALINQAATLSNTIKTLADPILSLIIDKSALVATLVSAYKGFGDLSPSPEVAVASFQRLQTLQVQTRTEYTDTAVLENKNRTATKRFNDVVALAQEARYVARYNFVAYEDAIRARRSIMDKLETAGQAATDDEYNLLRDLSAEIVKALPPPTSDLPHIRTLTLAKSLPAVKVAYDLYEDASRDEEIAQRNKARHPGFLPGGTGLEVLTDV